MADSWTTMTAADVQVGDRLRLATGGELTVSRIEAEFLGMDGLVAFIEDTSDRWFKQPMPMTAQVEVSRA